MHLWYMAAIARLRGWLDGAQDYSEGLALAEELSPNTPLLTLLKRGPGPFTSRKLCEELARLSKDLPAAAVEQQLRPVVVVQETTSAKPEAVRALEEERIAGFKEASHLHAQLRRVPTQEERRLTAVTIRQLFRRNAEIWSQLQYFGTHGHLPPVLPEQPAADLTDRFSITKRRNTLRTYISSQRGSEEKRKLWLAELADLDRRLSE